jgi:diadenosine tetraphosphatase ApaH/serine/threonine PP2A family protein phosphatase
MELTMAPRAILNPGSVGQPRDRDPQASYALYDTDQNKWEYRRIAYDIPAVQARMDAAGLPERHIQRLTAGW